MVVDPETGFLDHPSFSLNFGAKKKKILLEAIVDDPFWHGIAPVLKELGVSHQTYYVHLERDAAFRDAVEKLKGRFVHKVESRLMHDALQPGKTLAQFGVLRAYMPEKYNPQQRIEQHISLSFDGNSVGYAAKRATTLDAEIIPASVVHSSPEESPPTVNP